ncbi:hypothetical protein ACLIYM_25500 [Streptomyces fenghuangensis]
MRVQVLRVTGMPYDTGLWIRDRPNKFIVYIDAELITELGARLIEAALNNNIANWTRSPNRRRRVRDLLHVHTG